MSEPLTLDQILTNHLGPVTAQREWAEMLGVDAGAFSRVLTGRTALTENRAAKWAEAHYPDNPAAAATFAAELLAVSSVAPKTADELFQALRNSGGRADALQIGEIFSALAREKEPIAVVEYRDSLRAMPGAPYQDEARILANAIATGLTFVMIQPYCAEEVPHPAEPAKDGWKRPVPMGSSGQYMNMIRAECRRFYLLIRNDAAKNVERDTGVDAGAALMEIDQRLGLYERAIESFSGYGAFGSKLFMVQWRDARNMTQSRLFEWVSTLPDEADLLILRDGTLSVEAVKDNYYPIIHEWDRQSWRKKPTKLHPTVEAADDSFRQDPVATAPTKDFKLWKRYVQTVEAL